MRARTGSATALNKDEKAVVDKYVSLLDAVPGPVTVWVTTDEGLLHFYTLVPEGKENLRAVFRAERALLGTIDPLTVDFDVYENPEVAEIVFSNDPPVFRRS